MTNIVSRYWRRVRRCCHGSEKKDESSGTNSFETAFVEVDLLRADINAHRKYPDNSIRTSKYTWITSFPCSLLSQFYKVSNVYFLIVMTLTLIPGASPVNPFSSIVPLCIVLAAGVTKDLWEDGKRQTSDRRANATPTRVLRGNEFVMVAARDLKAGDIVLYKLGEEVLVDAIVLNTSLSDGVTYIETANLDGETNAKTRRAKPQTIDFLGTVEDIIEQCLPNTKLRDYYMRHGTTSGWRDDHEPYGYCAQENSFPKTQENNAPILVPPTSNPATESANPIYVPYPEERFRTTWSTGEFQTELRRVSRSGHLRSQTFGGQEVGRLGESTSQIRCHHRRQLTLDERFAMGRDLPVPSDMLALSRSYELRRKSEQTHRQSDSQFNALLSNSHSKGEVAEISFDNGGGGNGVKPNGSDGRLVNVPKEPAVTTATEIGERANRSLSEFTGPGSGVVLLAAVPCPELYSWIGQLRLPDAEMVPLGIEQFIPRGCVVRNTEWVLGATVYAGRDTKMLLNLRPKPRKISVIGARINKLNIFLFLVQQVLLFILSGLSIRWRNAALQQPKGTRSGFSTWYIQWFLSQYGPNVLFGWRYITHFVLLSYFIPLSLYVTLEFNKAMQMILLAYDRRMANFDEFNGELRYSRPKTSELNCQLAHVQYIFTDKTGTLTENLMTYVGGCTATIKHDERVKPGGLGESFLHLVRGRTYDFNEAAVEYDPTFQYLRALSLCHTVVCFERPNEELDINESNTVSSLNPVGTPNRPPRPFASPFNALSATEMHERHASAPFGASVSGTHVRTASAAGRHLHGRTGSASWYAARHNDIQTHARTLTMPKDIQKMRDESKIYEGQSLDEIALVSAARDNLFALHKRNAKHMFVKVLNKVMCYEIIAELEFTPQRKLMSILLYRNPEYDRLFPADPTQQPGMGSEERMGYHRQPETSLSPPPPPPERELPPEKAHIINIIGTNRGNIMNRVAHDVLTLASDDDDEEDDEDEEDNGKTKRGGGRRAAAVTEGDAAKPYLLLVKGADSSMLDILNKRNPRIVELRRELCSELEAMAQQGLRTLMLGQRYCSESEVREWLPLFNEALCSMSDRSEKLHEVYALMERDIDLIGTTAVEDRLQEGVPETLEFFLQAEIVVWMLTGDKRETAVTIACTSGIVSSQFDDCICHLDVTEAVAAYGNIALAACAEDVTSSLDSQLEAAITHCDEADQRYGGARSTVLVVDGRTLDVIFDDADRTRQFFELGSRCRSAVCCRMTPLQKAQVVRLFQKNTKSVALAIGDGANDVSMIQESHIGVGIMGLEGSQAELASDYAIPKFRFLKRLLVVHGRFSLYREGNCIVFSLYKNIVLASGLSAYAFYSGYSGMTLVESWLLALFNLLFCSLQPIAIGILDKDVEDEMAESLPAIYPALSREQMYFSWVYICKWIADGVVDGLVLFFIIRYTVARWDELYPWHSAALEDYGVLFFVMMLLVLNLRAAALITSYTALFSSVVSFCFGAIPVILLIYSSFHNILGSNWCVYIVKELMRTGKFWIFVLLAAGLYVVYGLAVNTYITLFWPWANGGPAMRTAWRSPFRKEHHERRKRLRNGEWLLWGNPSEREAAERNLTGGRPQHAV